MHLETLLLQLLDLFAGVEHAAQVQERRRGVVHDRHAAACRRRLAVLAADQQCSRT